MTLMIIIKYFIIYNLYLYKNTIKMLPKLEI